MNPRFMCLELAGNRGKVPRVGDVRRRIPTGGGGGKLQTHATLSASYVCSLLENGTRFNGLEIE